jgi:hypothetical protein
VESHAAESLSSCSVTLVAQKPQSRPVTKRRALLPSPCVRMACRTSSGTSSESRRQGRSGGTLFFASSQQKRASAPTKIPVQRQQSGSWTPNRCGERSGSC